VDHGIACDGSDNGGAWDGGEGGEGGDGGEDSEGGEGGEGVFLIQADFYSATRLVSTQRGGVTREADCVTVLWPK